MTTTGTKKEAKDMAQWILDRYPEQSTVILYEGIVNGRFAIPRNTFPLHQDSPELVAYVEAQAILALAQDRLYYAIQEAIQEGLAC